MPAAALLAIQDDLWKQTLRALHWAPSRDASLRAGAMNTQSGRGKLICWGENWLEALESAVGLENFLRDKRITRQRAVLVRIILEKGRLHGVAMCS